MPSLATETRISLLRRELESLEAETFEICEYAEVGEELLAGCCSTVSTSTCSSCTSTSSTSTSSCSTCL